MKISNTLSRSLALSGGLLLAGLVGSADASSPWLPETGHGYYGASYSHSSFDQFWRGDTKVDGPGPGAEGVTQVRGGVNFEYGIAPRWAVDLAAGWTEAEFSPIGQRSGLDDVQLGFRYGILDPSDPYRDDSFPLAFRLGAVMPGNYELDEPGPHAPGDGAWGLEASFHAGQSIQSYGGFSYASFGFRLREAEVPEELFGQLGIGANPIPALTLLAGVAHARGLSGQDIGDAGFRFPALREERTRGELSASWKLPTGQALSMTMIQTMAGRNTGAARLWQGSISAGF